MLYNGVLLDPVKDRQKRQDLVVKLSEITANMQAIQVADNVMVYVQNSEFSLKVIPPETFDKAGRLAPVLCFGKMPQQDAEVREFYQLLRSFLKRTGRDYDDKQLEEDVNRAFELVKKNRRSG